MASLLGKSLEMSIEGLSPQVPVMIVENNKCSCRCMTEKDEKLLQNEVKVEKQQDQQYSSPISGKSDNNQQNQNPDSDRGNGSGTGSSMGLPFSGLPSTSVSQGSSSGSEDSKEKKDKPILASSKTLMTSISHTPKTVKDDFNEESNDNFRNVLELYETYKDHPLENKLGSKLNDTLNYALTSHNNRLKGGMNNDTMSLDILLNNIENTLYGGGSPHQQQQHQPKNTHHIPPPHHSKSILDVQGVVNSKIHDAPLGQLKELIGIYIRKYTHRSINNTKNLMYELYKLKAHEPPIPITSKLFDIYLVHKRQLKGQEKHDPKFNIHGDFRLVIKIKSKDKQHGGAPSAQTTKPVTPSPPSAQTTKPSPPVQTTKPVTPELPSAQTTKPVTPTSHAVQPNLLEKSPIEEIDTLCYFKDFADDFCKNKKDVVAHVNETKQNLEILLKILKIPDLYINNANHGGGSGTRTKIPIKEHACVELLVDYVENEFREITCNLVKKISNLPCVNKREEARKKLEQEARLAEEAKKKIEQETKLAAEREVEAKKNMALKEAAKKKYEADLLFKKMKTEIDIAALSKNFKKIKELITDINDILKPFKPDDKKAILDSSTTLGIKAEILFEKAKLVNKAREHLSKVQSHVNSHPINLKEAQNEIEAAINNAKKVLEKQPKEPKVSKEPKDPNKEKTKVKEEAKVIIANAGLLHEIIKIAGIATDPPITIDKLKSAVSDITSQKDKIHDPAMTSMAEKVLDHVKKELGTKEEEAKRLAAAEAKRKADEAEEEKRLAAVEAKRKADEAEAARIAKLKADAQAKNVEILTKLKGESSFVIHNEIKDIENYIKQKHSVTSEDIPIIKDIIGQLKEELGKLQKTASIIVNAYDPKKDSFTNVKISQITVEPSYTIMHQEKESLTTLIKAHNLLQEAKKTCTISENLYPTITITLQNPHVDIATKKVALEKSIKSFITRIKTLDELKKEFTSEIDKPHETGAEYNNIFNSIIIKLEKIKTTENKNKDANKKHKKSSDCLITKIDGLIKNINDVVDKIKNINSMTFDNFGEHKPAETQNLLHTLWVKKHDELISENQKKIDGEKQKLIQEIKDLLKKPTSTQQQLMTPFKALVGLEKDVKETNPLKAQIDLHLATHTLESAEKELKRLEGALVTQNTEKEISALIKSLQPFLTHQTLKDKAIAINTPAEHLLKITKLYNEATELVNSGTCNDTIKLVEALNDIEKTPKTNISHTEKELPSLLSEIKSKITECLKKVTNENFNSIHTAIDKINDHTFKTQCQSALNKFVETNLTKLDKKIDAYLKGLENKTEAELNSIVEGIANIQGEFTLELNISGGQATLLKKKELEDHVEKIRNKIDKLKKDVESSIKSIHKGDLEKLKSLISAYNKHFQTKNRTYVAPEGPKTTYITEKDGIMTYVKKLNSIEEFHEWLNLYNHPEPKKFPVFLKSYNIERDNDQVNYTRNQQIKILEKIVDFLLDETPKNTSKGAGVNSAETEEDRLAKEAQSKLVPHNEANEEKIKAFQEEVERNFSSAEKLYKNFNVLKEELAQFTAKLTKLKDQITPPVKETEVTLEKTKLEQDFKIRIAEIEKNHNNYSGIYRSHASEYEQEYKKYKESNDLELKRLSNEIDSQLKSTTANLNIDLTKLSIDHINELFKDLDSKIKSQKESEEESQGKIKSIMEIKSKIQKWKAAYSEYTNKNKKGENTYNSAYPIEDEPDLGIKEADDEINKIKPDTLSQKQHTEIKEIHSKINDYISKGIKGIEKVDEELAKIENILSEIGSLEAKDWHINNIEKYTNNIPKYQQYNTLKESVLTDDLYKGGKLVKSVITKNTRQEYYKKLITYKDKIDNFLKETETIKVIIYEIEKLIEKVKSIDTQIVKFVSEVNAIKQKATAYKVSDVDINKNLNEFTIEVLEAKRLNVESQLRSFATEQHTVESINTSITKANEEYSEIDKNIKDNKDSIEKYKLNIDKDKERLLTSKKELDELEFNIKSDKFNENYELLKKFKSTLETTIVNKKIEAVDEYTEKVGAAAAKIDKTIGIFQARGAEKVAQQKANELLSDLKSIKFPSQSESIDTSIKEINTFAKKTPFAHGKILTTMMELVPKMTHLITGITRDKLDWFGKNKEVLSTSKKGGNNSKKRIKVSL